MRLTNLQNLPEAIVRAVSNDSYDKGQCDFSCTELLKPSRIWALERRHKDDLVEDVADRIYALLGQLGHLLLERAAQKMNPRQLTLVEERLYRSIVVPGMTRPVIIGGQIDLALDPNGPDSIQDYKFTSRWAALHGAKDDWHNQLNINAWLSRANGFDPKNAQVVAVYYDWSKREAAFRARTGQADQYPQSQVEVFDIPLKSDSVVSEFIAARVVSHVQAHRIQLPECTPEERWQRPAKWAVTKAGNKRASKLCDTLEESTAWAQSKLPPKETETQSDGRRVEAGKVVYEILPRPAEAIRCADFCVVAEWCEQWQNDSDRPAPYVAPVVPLRPDGRGNVVTGGVQ